MVKKLKIKENISNVQDSLQFLEYKIIGNSITIIGCDPKARHIDILSEIEGYPVITIGEAAFYDCSRLTSITIPDTVTTIGNAAFLDCSRLTSITIPNTVIAIGDDAFYDCFRLTSITIPNSVTTIGKRVFTGCDNLQEITVSEKLFNKYSDVFNTPDLFDCEFIIT